MVALKDRQNALQEPVRPPARTRHHLRHGARTSHDAVGPDPLRRDLPVVRRRLRHGDRPTRPAADAASPTRPGSTAPRCAPSPRSRRARPGEPAGRPRLRGRRLRRRPASPTRSSEIDWPRSTCRSPGSSRCGSRTSASPSEGEGWKLTERGRDRAGRRPAGQLLGRRALVQPDRRVGHAPLRRGGPAGAGPGRRPPGRRRPQGARPRLRRRRRSSSPCGSSAATSPDPRPAPQDEGP